MTPQEQQLIDGLLGRIRETKVEDKDTQAEQYLQQGLAGYPDALYVLAQTVLVQQYGLQQAKAQMDQLRQQNDQMQQQMQSAGSEHKSSGSFLSHIFGGGGTSPQPPVTQGQAQTPGYQPVNNPGYGPGNYPPPPNYPPQAYPAPSGGMFGGGGFGGGGFLAGALQTAAGVAAGEAVFTGMEDLFHGFEHRGGEYAGGFDGGHGETVVNNYYDDDRGDRGDRTDGRDNDQGFYNDSDDASRQDLGAGDSGADFGDTSSFDDGSGLDSSSDFDNSGDFNS